MVQSIWPLPTQERINVSPREKIYQEAASIEPTTSLSVGNQTNMRAPKGESYDYAAFFLEAIEEKKSINSPAIQNCIDKNAFQPFLQFRNVQFKNCTSN